MKSDSLNVKSFNKSKGNRGEKIALDYLLSKNFKILEKNYRAFHKEIDIIAENDGCIVFVEVKLRMGLDFGYPIESVTKKKINNIRLAAEEYLYKNGINNRHCRIDFISILKIDDKTEIEHIENIGEY